MTVPRATYKSFAEIAEDTAILIHSDLWPAYINKFGDALLTDFWLNHHTDGDGASLVIMELNRGHHDFEPADRSFVFRLQGIVGRPIVVRDTREGTDPSWSLLADCTSRDWDTQARQYLLDTLYLPNVVAAEWMQRNGNQNIEVVQPTKKKARQGSAACSGGARGRPKDSGAYNDTKAYEKMKELIDGETAKSPYQAAGMVVREGLVSVKGFGVDASLIKRLYTKYPAWAASI